MSTRICAKLRRLATTRPLMLVLATGVLSSHSDTFGPGQRVLLDAHNAYPERGQWSDRLERALATSTPLAIEQDLYWGCDAEHRCAPVVAHDDNALDGAPTLTSHFFDAVRPRMEKALRENRRDQWPLIVLNLDFKQDTAPLLDSVWTILAQHQRWLTVAPRTANPSIVEPLSVGPMLVLTGSSSAQRARFHDALAVGEPLLAFGAMTPVRVPGRSRSSRARTSIRMRAEEHIPRAADNYARWVNFPWSVMEQGGQAKADRWTPTDDARLRSFAARAHELGYWIRFYTLDGFSDTENRGWTVSYNFGSLGAARIRWRAARSAGVDFIATDQYEAFAADR